MLIDCVLWITCLTIYAAAHKTAYLSNYLLAMLNDRDIMYESREM